MSDFSVYDILKEYFNVTAKPTFSDFISRKYNAIQHASFSLQSETALELHSFWVKQYNEVIRIERVGQRLQAAPKSVSLLFTRIFEVVKERRNTAHEFELASLRVSREALKDVAVIAQGDGGHNTEVVQEDGSNTEVVQEAGHNTHNTEVFQEAGAKANPFNNEFTPVEQSEFEKLNNSNCLNFISRSYRSYYKHTMSAYDYSEIIERSSELREEFDNGLDEADKKMIDNLFSELEVFADNVNTDQIINFLDEKKFEVKDKNSERYLLLCIIYRIVFDIPIWAREHKFCEATFVRKFQEILDILFKNTKIFAKDGESSSEAAKSNQIIGEDGTQYGRKLDVMILSEQNDHDDIEVCSNEFKKPDATSTMKCYQQSKNLRLNACIWKKLFDISKKKNLSVNYFDFIGRRGILTQLFFHKNNFVGHALCQFVIVKSLVELELLRESILNLYKWRRTVKKTSHFISTAIAQQVNKYTLADIYDVTESNLATSSPTILPNICLSPPRPTTPAKRKLK